MPNSFFDKESGSQSTAGVACGGQWVTPRLLRRTQFWLQLLKKIGSLLVPGSNPHLIFYSGLSLGVT
jgi:hypothetical protein